MNITSVGICEAKLAVYGLLLTSNAAKTCERDTRAGLEIYAQHPSISVMQFTAQSPATATWQHQPQPVYTTAVWEAVQKNPLLHR